MGTFAENLREAREIKGLSKTDMANFLDLTLTAYSLYEKGEREPPLKNLRKISKILDISVDDLIDEKSKEEDFEIEFKFSKTFWESLHFRVLTTDDIVIISSEHFTEPLKYKKTYFVKKTIDFMENFEPYPPTELLEEFVLLIFDGLDRNKIVPF